MSETRNLGIEHVRVQQGWIEDPPCCGNCIHGEKAEPMNCKKGNFQTRFHSKCDLWTDVVEVPWVI